MTTHRLTVLLMLAVTTVLAVSYVSTFPVEGEFAPSVDRPSQLQEPGKPATVPASEANGPTERQFDAGALKHLA